MLSSHYNHNFAMEFPNGLTISIAFGPGNYCKRRNFTDTIDNDLKFPSIHSDNAEIAIWDENSTDFKFKSGDIAIGWVNPEEVAKWIFVVSQATSLDDINTVFDSISIVV